MKLYKIFKNTGNWGGFHTELVIEENELSAAIESFSGRTYQAKLEAHNNWKKSGFDLVVNEVKDGQDLVNCLESIPRVPDGYELIVNFELKKID